MSVLAVPNPKIKVSLILVTLVGGYLRVSHYGFFFFKGNHC